MSMDISGGVCSIMERACVMIVSKNVVASGATAALVSVISPGSPFTTSLPTNFMDRSSVVAAISSFLACSAVLQPIKKLYSLRT